MTIAINSLTKEQSTRRATTIGFKKRTFRHSRKLMSMVAVNEWLVHIMVSFQRTFCTDLTVMIYHSLFSSSGLRSPDPMVTMVVGKRDARYCSSAHDAECSVACQVETGVIGGLREAG